METLPALTYETEILASAQAVWTALTTSEATMQWHFGNTVESAWERGAQLIYRGADGEVDIECEITDIELEVYFRSSFKPVWSADVANIPASRVEWRLTENENSTLVVITHSDVVADSQVVRETAEGWPHLLASLKAYCES